MCNLFIIHPFMRIPLHPTAKVKLINVQWFIEILLTTIDPHLITPREITKVDDEVRTLWSKFRRKGIRITLFNPVAIGLFDFIFI